MGWQLANTDSQLEIPEVSAIPSFNSATISWDSIINAEKYRVYLTPQGSLEYFVGETSGLNIVATGLSANYGYDARVIAHIVATPGGTVTFETLSATAITYHKSYLMNMMYSNGMLNAVGSDPIEGPISASGRTYNGCIPGSMVSPYTAPGVDWQASREPHMIYGIQFKFSNLHDYPISGGKMVVGGVQTTAWEGQFTPTAGNVSATVPTSGWTKVTINGDENLPVRASTSAALGSDWSDMIMIPGGVSAGSISQQYSFAWRFFRPQTSAADYAMTYASWGESDYQRASNVNGIYRTYSLDHLDLSSFIYKYYYADGDGVSNLSAIPTSAFEAHMSPQALGKYGPPGPGSFPFDAVRFLTDVGEITQPIDQIIGIGDSITEGYKDKDAVVSCLGVFGRNLREQYLSANNRVANYINLGQSGFLVRQYLQRARGYINADPSSISVAVVSVYTPNIVSGETFDYAWRPSTLLDNKNALIEFEDFCVSNSIVFVPVFWCMSPLGVDTNATITMSAHIDDLKTRWPWLINASTVIQTSANYPGPFSDSYWCPDATHPTGPNPVSDDPETAGYERLRRKFNQDFPASLAAAKAHYGI